MKMNDNGMFTLKLDPGFFRVSTAAKYRITIECDGDTTTAKMVVNGKEVKTATAKRNPNDKANWRIGAQPAFDRLWQKKEKPERSAEKDGFRVGDRVVINAPKPGNVHAAHGKHGTIVFMESNAYVAVELDEPVYGHDCVGQTKPGHGCYANAENLRHEQPTKQKVREVKRKAKVGEYVKITKPAFNFMQTGDIVRVSSVDLSNGSALVRECDLARPSGATASPNYEWVIFNFYVVLEGYQPGRDA